MKKNIAIIAVLFLLFSWGCTQPGQSVTETSAPSLEVPALSLTIEITSVPPTETPVPQPAAALVNGEGILLSDFEEEFLRYKDSLIKSGAELDETVGRATVLENMIDELLLAQGARENGYQLTDEIYQERRNSLISQLGDESKLQTWMSENHFSEESFNRIYKIEIEAAVMRDSILASVPTSAEQIHARQILVQSKTLAEELYAQLQSGADFATIAWIYDATTGGELSWFPRNYLVIKEVEDALFSLEAGAYTPILSTENGYQIVQVVEREANRPLTQDALLVYQRAALKQWIQDKKQNSSISIETK
jgi:parvulin-like peptidyl-prolyl isomerase